MSLPAVVEAVFTGSAEIIALYQNRAGAPFWTLVAGFPGGQVELKGRCTASGAWKVILEASVSGV